MSSASSLLSEEQFLCSICLDVFTDPVTIPCGHNFCKNCIAQHWDANIQCQCPMCKDVFDRRPELRINPLISELAAQFRQSAVKKSSSDLELQLTKPGEVLCDICTETKLMALKSCLVCLASYCETHLELHQKMTGLTKHKLIDPVENLKDRMCKKHERPLEMFCKTDQMCVCFSCPESDHKSHVVIPMIEEYEVKKAKLGEFEAEIQQMIQERRLKILEFKQSVMLSKEDQDREKADSVQVFTALIQSVERGLAKLIDMIEEKQKTTEKQAEGFIKELEDEISVLMKRSAEVEELSHNEDHLQVLQSFPSLNPAPPTKDWTEVRVHSSYEGTVRRAVAQLEETLSKEITKLLEAELKRVQQFAVDVTLDPDTANPNLILSDDGKQVYHSDAKQNLPDNPERFTPNTCVLAKQSFSLSRFYYEVQVKGKTRWELGVARGSINRKQIITPNTETGPWILILRNGNEYKALAGPGVPLSLKSKPQKVGVFVDYEEGLVSFYDVDAATLIYSFTGCNFTEKLYPIFGPCTNDGGKNSAPLIISPVNMSAACSFLSEDQFLCSICLDVFTHPVTIPCGHNFCKNCITQHWNINVPCQCPMCKDVFDKRPELRVNPFICEMAAQFRQSAVKKVISCSVLKCANSGEVLCDVCAGTKLKALKSCLVCLASYCETHLELHHRVPGLKRHELIDPVENLEDRMCKRHDRPLEVFCKTDQMCICQFCTESNHRSHVFIPIIQEYEVKKTKLGKLEGEIQQMIQERRLKIQQIKQSVKLSKEDADRETADSMEVFTALIQSVERGLSQLIDMIEEKQKTTEKQAEGFIKELEEEISVLMKRSAEVEQLSRNEDHLQVLQSFPSLSPAPPTKDWTGVKVHSSYEGTMRRAVAQLEKTLSEETKKLCADLELKRVQQFAVDVTLDPDTASPYLILSDDEKQVRSDEKEKNVPDTPQRFSYCNGVLGKQSFSSGRYYYEVQVRDKTDWDLGVAKESVTRKGKIRLSPKNGFWTIWFRKGNEYKALAGPGVLLSLKSKPEKVGVFVDYEEGLVSFYDVDAAALIYCFTSCNFTEKLYPYFSPCCSADGINGAPLILLPLRHTK
ncbi:uncharacterized protein ABDE67_021142 [Symphorus nematophorus]